MRVVNVKELKARLSAYLREANRGETCLVTDGSEVVARLIPPQTESDGRVEADDVMSRLVAMGCLRQRAALARRTISGLAPRQASAPPRSTRFSLGCARIPAEHLPGGERRAP